MCPATSADPATSLYTDTSLAEPASPAPGFPLYQRYNMPTHEHSSPAPADHAKVVPAPSCQAYSHATHLPALPPHRQLGPHHATHQNPMPWPTYEPTLAPQASAHIVTPT